MRRLNGWVMAGMMLGTAGMAGAHLKTGSLTLTGGETLKAGDIVTVQWDIESTHPDGSFDINFSKDGGETFTLIEKKIFPLSPGKVSYKWTIPNEATTKGRFQLCQYFNGEARCDGVYTLQSEDINIAKSTGVIQKTRREKINPSLHFNAETRNLNVLFTMEKEEMVIISAFDAQGKWFANLVEEKFPAGKHMFAVLANRVNSDKPMLFQLRVGSQVKSLEWSGMR